MANVPWVVLAECTAHHQVHMLRGSLETARIPVRTEGEATAGTLGWLHGAAMPMRVLVPQPALEQARQACAELLGLSRDNDDVPDPYRDEPLDEGDDASVDDDDDERPTPKAKSYAVPLLLGAMSLAVGFVHMYAGRPRTAKVLLTSSICVLALMLTGHRLGALIFPIMAFDLIGGMYAVARYNRNLKMQLPSA